MAAGRWIRTGLVLLGGLSLVWLAPAGATTGTQTQTQTCPVLGFDPDSVTLTGPAALWPPNHRLVDYTLTAAETPQEAGDGLPHGVSISYMVTTADASGGDGGQAHNPDATPPAGTASGDFSVSIPFQLRAERSALGRGRTYTINWAASFDGGLHMCSSQDGSHNPFVVTVAHDQRG
jgi:hypothetical protein